jgi:hypothetical protein
MAAWVFTAEEIFAAFAIELIYIGFTGNWISRICPK